MLTFNQGSMDGTLACEPFTSNDDDILEDSEFFQVSLASPTGGAGLASPTTANVTITDDDGKEVVFQYTNYISACLHGSHALAV